MTAAEIVLIESDWNLKCISSIVSLQHRLSINRIRLEFKGACKERKDLIASGINRIRLEFKVS